MNEKTLLCVNLTTKVLEKRWSIIKNDYDLLNFLIPSSGFEDLNQVVKFVVSVELSNKIWSYRIGYINVIVVEMK